MSPRRHHQSQPISQPISWLAHRTGFPSEAERQALISRRKKLRDELLPVLLENYGPDDPPGRRLVQKYGWEEVEWAIEMFDEAREMPSFIADEAHSYRLYRHRYARFGGQRPFYSYQDLCVVQDEAIKLYIDRFKADRDFPKKPREKEIEDLLLEDWRTWEYITLPAVPPHPGNFKSPTPAAFREPASALLAWGTDLELERIENEAKAPERWLSQLSALECMSLDPGLLDGWPGDSQSWAPWHALQLLGALEAWQSVPALAELSGRPNDLLSDLLPEVWARMGMAVEPVLWVMLEDTSAPLQRRGLAAEALTFLVEDEPLLSGKIAQEFGQIVQNAQPCDPTLNSYPSTSRRRSVSWTGSVRSSNRPLKSSVWMRRS